MTVFCDNGDCCYISEDGFCGCDKLSVVGGVCTGSYHSGRNVCDGDVDERLKAENEQLRQRITTQKQTIQVYRDESREWRGIADARGQTIDRMGAENAELHDALKALVVGTEAELYDDRDARQCKECSMSMGDSECALTVAMDLLSIDAFGESVTYPDGEVDG